MRVFLNNFFLLTTVVSSTISNSQFLRHKQNHKINELSNSDIRHLARLSDTRHVDEMLDHILVPRVVSTAGHDRVYEFIKRQLNDLDWDVEVDEFKDRTPFGELTFKNIIGTLNPQAERFLVLSCHYDSKYFQNEEFLGATDSAVPCAMLLNMAKVMKNEFDSLDSSSELGLKFIFFDGEEAFVQWGPNDSIYGARHLAKLYDDTMTRSKTSGEMVSHLDRMDVFVLLDLLGTRNPNFVSYHRSTEQWFVRLVEIEAKLESLNLLQNHRNKQYFQRKRSLGRIEDDHIPFLQRNVPILHLIPTPFPSVWHTIDDDRSVIDMDTVENLNKILRVFVAEYLHLSLDRPAGKEEDPHDEL